MSEDVRGEILENKKDLNTSLQKEFLVDGPTIDTGDNEVDHSFRTNLKQPDLQNKKFSSACLNNGKMDVEKLDDAEDKCATTQSVNFTNVQSSLGNYDRRALSPSLKDCVGSKFVNDKKHMSTNNAVTCEAAKSSDLLRPLTTIRPTSGCRSGIQDIHDSSLRMDALPNVSPDSGIVSFEGSPFGNESPHSGVGGENSQEMNSSLATSLINKNNKAISDLEVAKTTPSPEVFVTKEKVDIALKEQQSLSELPYSVNQSSDEVSDIHPKNCDVKLSVSDIAVKKSHENEVLERHPYIKTGGEESHTAAKTNSITEDCIIASPSKVSTPECKKKSVSPNNNKRLKADCKRNAIGNNPQQACETLAKEENRVERQLEKSETTVEATAKVNVDKLAVLSEGVVDSDPLTKRRYAGRPRGSLNKKFECHPPRRTYRKPVPKLPEYEHIETPSKRKKSLPSPNEEKISRPRGRGRPRKVLSSGESKTLQRTKTLKIVKKKRKRIFTRVKKSNVNKLSPQSHGKISSKGKTLNDNLYKHFHDEPPKNSNLSLQHSPPKLFLESNVNPSSLNDEVMPKKSKEISQIVNTDNKLDFSGKDLEALLTSVKSSIKSQFRTEKDEEMGCSLSFDSPFKFLKAPSFPQMAHSPEICPVRPKPKYKKPKLHVMMRKTKRKKKKKFESKRLGSFGALSPQKRLSFFTSCIQPSKILASSRLNVFQTGTGVDLNRPETPTDGEQTEGSEKRAKKRHKLLSFKSKHKNLKDPAFAADLVVLEVGLKNMAISENATDNYIRVRPGEMPLPSIFKVIKIDVMKKVKEKSISESCGLETKFVKSTKKENASQELFHPSIKNISKSIRKKTLPEHNSTCKEQTSLSDSSDQWLPPKKRHRMVHMESLMPQATDMISSGVVAMADSSHVDNKRKGRRQKKIEGDSSVVKSVSHQSIDQVLTIDTSSYSTAGSSASTLTPSPCPSRQSTRSSTIPSVSSLSPEEFTGIYSKLNSKIHGSLACPKHSQTVSLQDDFVLSCAECQLLRQSTSTYSSIVQSNTSLPQTLNQSVERNSFFGNLISSSESSSSIKNSTASEQLSRRHTRKRRKSFNCKSKETDLSPPHLERHSVLTSSLSTPHLYSSPPEIFPIQRNPSPQRQPAVKKSSGNSTRSSTLSPITKSLKGSSHRSLRHPSFLPPTSDSQLCNSSTPVNLSQLSASPSVIPVLSNSDWQPLPLEHCKNKELVGEIQAALQCDSSENSSNHEEQEEHQYPSTVDPGQPPRKRYQRVGLFSDFYKDDEPRKRCENMVRCREKLVYVKDEHEYGLMPLPIHVGYHYMTQIQDFQLPYDIWWQDFHNQLPKKSEAKSKFRNIRSNLYVDGKANCRKKEIPACSCKPPLNGGTGCLDDCLNRMIYTECSMMNCPLGERCNNQRIQKHDWAPGIEKFLTEDRGFGVRVTKPVKSGHFILEYLGEVVSETEFRRRMMEEYSEECHHYALHLDSGNVIDGYRMGNIGRYVNHSCQPNCEMQKWNVNGLYRMVLFALRDIEAFEELGYDYNFDAFNQETQQECRCGSSECRGVIGGKGQRNNGVNKQEKIIEDPNDKRKSKLINKKARDRKYMVENAPVLPPPMSLKERCFARKHSMFLVRNIDKVLNQRHPGQVFSPIPKEEKHTEKVNCVTSDVLLSNLTESSVKTRLASFAKDNPEILRRHQLARIFDKILTELLSLKDQEGNSMVTPLMSLPSRKKQPQYYQIVKEPIDLSVIKQRVKTGHYSHLKAFTADLMLLFKNVELYCGPKSDMGQVIVKLRQLLICAVQELSSQIDEFLGAGTTKTCIDMNLEMMDEGSGKDHQEPKEDVIRCICGVTRDEGLMLQCEKCMRWQHCDCVRATGKEEHYLCDRCEPRYYDPEILLAPPLPDSLPDCTHFMTLVKDDVQYAIGDCVYVMRDCKRSATGTPLRSSHRLIATSNPDSLDIFRIEQLWKDPKGERFASGTPYLRPQETFHEPTRKFLHNELFRTPNYEIIPLDLVMGKCVVMDSTTYCKGRPKGVKEQDVYVCEYRVDKTAHLFHKIKEIWYPLNTNRFCFDQFETKLILKRTFTPHEIPEEYRRKAIRNTNSGNCGKGNGKPVVKEEKPDTKKPGKNHPILHSKVKMDESLKHDIKLKAEVKVNVKKGSDFNKDVKIEDHFEKTSIVKMVEVKRKEKRQRLDRLCIKLLNSMPGKQKVDLSYLLDGGKRIRKKLIK